MANGISPLGPGRFNGHGNDHSPSAAKWIINKPEEAQRIFSQAITALAPNTKLKIGRQDSDLFINNLHISIDHAEIRYDGSNYYVKDLSSTNGTRLIRQGGNLEIKIFPNTEQVINFGDTLCLADLKVEFSATPPSEPVAPPIIAPPFNPDQEAVTSAAIALRDKVRQGGQLLFTRNIDLEELRDLAEHNALRPKRIDPKELEGVPNHIALKRSCGIKCFRYGLGHEYGKTGEVLTLVMKPVFWETKKGTHELASMFLDSLDGQKIKRRISPYYPDEEIPNQDLLLRSLAERVEYNRLLGQREFKPPSDHQQPIGSTVLGTDKFMGNFPQLEVSHSIPIDHVEKILVPEHMWTDVTALAESNPGLMKLLKKVEGTGSTQDVFLEGREKLGRRTRFMGGDFEPNFGYASFHAFEQAYFQLVLGELNGSQKAAVAEEEFIPRSEALFSKYGYSGHSGLSARWLSALPANEPPGLRNEHDWKIFVNPREEKHFEVLEAVLKALSARKELGINFKTTLDYSAEWRPGRKFSAANSPKIVIYVSEQTLPIIMKALEEEITNASLNAAGFGAKPGPAFAKRYGKNEAGFYRTDLLFYKKEYGYNGEGDERVSIANRAEEAAQAKDISDEKELMRLKSEALRAAGFTGDNFYMKAGEWDPFISVQQLSRELAEAQASKVDGPLGELYTIMSEAKKLETDAAIANDAKIDRLLALQQRLVSISSQHKGDDDIVKTALFISCLIGDKVEKIVG